MPPPPGLKPIAKERAFKLDELFFSTTDQRGVIRYGNEVFTRIAGYALDQMEGQPHNLIRHPDMPRCAFRLVWDYLKQDRIVGAYVKNMASDGRYYWVFALIMPTPDGYLSIRLKPSSKVFEIVKGAYQAVLEEEEQAKALGAPSKTIMDAGAEKLMQLLGSLGFKTYDQFLWAALSAEMASRHEKLGDSAAHREIVIQPGDDEEHKRLAALFNGAIALERKLGDVVANPQTFEQLSEQIIPKSDFVMGMGQDIRLQSVNAEIQAARLGETAMALAQVAENLSKHAVMGTQTVENLNKKLGVLGEPISQLVFQAMMSKVQIEMAAAFVHEIIGGKHDASEHHRLIENLRLLFRTFIRTSRHVPAMLKELTRELDHVEKHVQELDKFLKTLRFVYLAGKIETARHSNAMSFAQIFEEIYRMIHRADDVLGELLDALHANRSQIESLVSIDAKHFDQLQSLLAA